MSEQEREAVQWSATPGAFEVVRRLGPAEGSICSLDWSPDGKHIAAVIYMDSIRIWDLSSGEQRIVKGDDFCPVGLSWDSDSHIAFGGDEASGVLDIKEERVDIRVLLNMWAIPYVSLVESEGDIYYGGAGAPLLVVDIESGTERTVCGSIDSFCMDRGSGRVAVAHSGALDLIDPSTGEILYDLPVDGEVEHIEWSTVGDSLSACVGSIVEIWDADTRQRVIRLEAHLSRVFGSAYSSDGRLLATVGNDAVRIWRCADWRQVASLEFLKSDLHAAYDAIAFHPSDPSLLAFAAAGHEVWVCRLDLDRLLGTATDDHIRYTTARIALVGDSGVGKTTLGWRLAFDEFKEQSSTHGHQFWVLDALCEDDPEGIRRDVVLWDLAGQPDYRIVHALFVGDADLALFLFDASQREEPLEGVEYWHRAFTRGRAGSFRSLLVGSRLDRGAPSLTTADLDAFCTQRHITGGYAPTSARDGTGVAELRELIRAQLPWAELTPTVTTRTFKRIKDLVLERKQAVTDDQVLVSFPELRAQLEALDPNWQFSEPELETAVRHVANHGYVRLVTTAIGHRYVLLVPDLLGNLAASMVLEARRNPRGLGVLDEDLLLRGGHAFPEVQPLSPTEREMLLDAATHLFLRSNLCFRETLGNQHLLVFPALINEKRPRVDAAPTMQDCSYLVTGAIENVYASLVVLLGYTNTFTRTNQWQNQAQYELDEGELCGFEQLQSRAGEMELVLYFTTNVRRDTRLLFRGLFERFLRHRDVTVSMFPAIDCTDCGERQERAQVVRRIRDRKGHLFCGECGARNELPAEGEDPTAMLLSPAFNRDEAAARLRTRYEAALVRIKRLVDQRALNDSPPSCFLSYAWGDREHERWVERLARDLSSSGLEVILDRWDNAEIGASVPRFVERLHAADFVLVVGTPRSLAKGDNLDPARGSVLAAERDLCNQRLLGTEAQKRTVMPLLREGTVETSLPPLLHTRVRSDFRDDATYFPTLFDLVLTLNGISPGDSAVADLREELARAYPQQP